MARRSPLTIFLSCLAPLLLVPGAAARGQPLVSPPVDYAIYRDGAVQRVEKQFGSWLMTCDEIRTLARKFCSLRGAARETDGTIIASLVVSTDDGGRPTALIGLPVGTLLRSGAIVLKGGAKRSATQLDLRPTLCDRRGCEVVWSLSADDIQTLSRGTALKVSFTMVARDEPFDRFDPVRAVRSIVGALPTAGFADALQASLK